MPKLVLVADTPWVANEVRAALAVDPWQVVEVPDPREATAMIEEARPPAVIVDMQVGSMGGMAVVRDIRQTIEERPRLVLLLDRSADRFIARRAGVDAAVLKPIDPASLREAVGPAEPEASAAPRRRPPSSTR
jgi:twitching motility two-component system response regulator PilG